MKHKFTIEYEGMNGKREFANTDELLVNGDNIEHMIVVPKEATNGDMIKAMFPSAIDKNVKPTNKIHFMDDFKGELYGIGVISLDWWNAPYKEEVEE